MDPIRPTQASALIEALRKLSKTKGASASASGDMPGNTGRADGGPSLREALGILAEGVDIDDDVALRAAQPKILRCILQYEWGEGASKDPAFAGILAALDQAIASDPRLVAVVREALQALRAGGEA